MHPYYKSFKNDIEGIDISPPCFQCIHQSFHFQTKETQKWNKKMLTKNRLTNQTKTKQN